MTVSICFLCIVLIITIYYCYVKRNKQKEENVVVDESGPQDMNSKYNNSLFVMKFKSFIMKVIFASYIGSAIEHSSIEIDGRSFPPGIVISWSDIKMEREIGQGNFGKVYQGYVNMNEVQR